MDFRLIKAFCAVYEEGSINKAATRLRIAQPNISVAIKNLEFDLRTQLFDRSSTGASPTPVAHAFYSRVKKALADLDTAHRALLGTTEDTGFSLRIGLPSFLAGLIASEQLPSLLMKYPDVDFRLVEGTPQWLIDLTIGHELDLAVVLTPPVDPRLKSHRLATEPFVLVSSSANRSVPNGAVDLTKTPPLKLALPWGQGSIRSVIDPHITSGNIQISKIVGINTMPPIIDLVKHTDWMTIFPASTLVRGFDDLIIREVVYPEIMAEHFTIRPTSVVDNPMADVFMKEVESTIQSYVKDRRFF